MSRPAKQMLLIVSLLSTVLTIGAVGYHMVEGWSWIMRAGDTMEFTPSGKVPIEPGNVLIAMGERSMLKRMEEQVEN